MRFPGTILSLSALVGIWPWAIYAQDARDDEPPKWGEIPQQHLEMDHYAPDSGAAVVVLSDYGNVYFQDDGTLVFERQTRIKILSEAGFAWGTVSVPYLADDRTQRVRDVKGQTYAVGSGSRIETQEMPKGSIFDEDVDGRWKRVRFTLPALRPGSVIEYRYKMTSTNPTFFPTWSFQKSEPVLRSEFRAEIPEIYRYVSVYQGQLAADPMEPETYSRRMYWNIYLGGDLATASAQVRGTRYRWVVHDVPALRPEPFMTNPENFRAKLRFELAAIGAPSSQTVEVSLRGRRFDLPGGQVPVTPVMTSWEQLAEELMDHGRFGKQIGRHRDVRNQARAVVDRLTSPREKMQAVYDYVRTTMSWTGQRGVVADRDLDEVLTARSADSPEIALLLVSMLRDAGLEAHPVLISTRSNGEVVREYPLVGQFDDVLTYVEIDSTAYLLDATDPLRPYTLLPLEALNGDGFLVRQRKPGWVSIVPTEQYRHRRLLSGRINASGDLVGIIEASDGGYSALESRRALEAAETADAFVQETLLEGIDGAVAESATVTNVEAVTEELETKANFTAPAFAQVAGEFIYLNPTPLGRLGENPLRLPERTFPVDLGYPRHMVYTFHMRLPEGYTVQETPRNVRILLRDGAGVYQRMIEDHGDVLMAQSQFVITQSVFEPERYQALRAFFEQVLAAEAEQVVLRRATE